MFQFTEHSFNVSKLLDVFGNNCVTYRNAALLHDIGKIYLDDEILNKKGSLTLREFEIIKRHVTFGVEHLEKKRLLPFNIKYEDIDPTTVRIVKEHHENYDGTGYFGLKGNEIHFGARVLRIIDCYDALISKRTYKEAMSQVEAICIMINMKDMFDPVLFEKFINTIGAQNCANQEAV